MNETNSRLDILEKPVNPLPPRFRIYFVTPTWFSGGWKPVDWKVFFDGEVKLRAAAVGKYQSVGGYDLSNKWHKPSRRFVPAGSVYYFESFGSSNIKDGIVNHALTEWGAEIGFGQFIFKEEW